MSEEDEVVVAVKWEIITRGGGESTDRLPVPGGWLYRTNARGGVALVFVPMPILDIV